MAAILGRPGGRRRRVGTPPVSYAVFSKGREFRVCATAYGRVLFVMRKGVRRTTETPLEIGGRRYREVVRAAIKEHGVELSYHRSVDGIVK